MTKTGMAALDREQKERELRETARSNRAREKTERAKAGAQYVNAIASGVSSIFNPVSRIVTGGKGGRNPSSVAPAMARDWGRYWATQRTNEPTWYKNYLTNLDLFTNVATYYRLGTTALQFDINQGTNYDRTPGVMIIRVSPTVGSSDGKVGVASLPINQILMRTKEQVLKSNSRSSVPYEAADLGFNFLATASIVASIADAERALLVAQTYSARNAYFAKGMLQALGWSSDVVKDLPRFRKLISIIIKRFNNACVAPADLAITKRWMYLNSNVFADSSSATAQMYAYVFDYYWRLSNDTLKLEAYIPTIKNIDGWYEAVSLMIQRIVENPDYQAMYADLRSALADNLLVLDDNIDGTATLAPTFDETARMQIENVESLPSFHSNADGGIVRPWIVEEEMEVTQTNEGFLKQGDSLGRLHAYVTAEDLPAQLSSTQFIKDLNALTGSGAKRTYNVHKDEVSGDDILEITRSSQAVETVYVAKYGIDQYPAYKFTIGKCGTEVVTCFTMYTFEGSATSVVGFNFSSYSCICEQVGVYDTMRLTSMHSTFDWTPFFMVCAAQFSSANVYTLNKFTHWDIEHPFDIARSTIGDITDACMMSLFYLDTSVFKR